MNSKKLPFTILGKTFVIILYTIFHRDLAYSLQRIQVHLFRVIVIIVAFKSPKTFPNVVDSSITFNNPSSRKW